MTRCRKMKIDRGSQSRVKQRRFLIYTLKKIKECCITMPHSMKTKHTPNKALLNTFAHKILPVPRYYRHCNAAYSICRLVRKTHAIGMKCIDRLEQTILAQKLMSSVASVQYQARNRTAKMYCKLQQKIRNQKLVCFIYHCHSFEWKATPSTRKGCYHLCPEEFCSHGATSSKKQDLKAISTPRLLEQYVAVYEFAKQTKDEIDVTVGDTIEVIEKYEDGWWLVNKNAEQGYVPGNYLKRCDSLKDSRIVAENSGEKYICIDAFDPDGPDDHSLKVGVVVELIQKNLDGWWWVSNNGKAGWAPATCLQLAEKNIQERLDNLGSGPIETISNLSEVSDLLKGQITSGDNSHIIAVDSNVKPKSPSCHNDYESDEFSDEDYDDDEEECHYSCIIYAPAPKRRNTFKDLKAASVKTIEHPKNSIPEKTSSTNEENVTSSGKEQKPDKNFGGELQSKLNRNRAALRPKSIPPAPPKRPDSITPKKKIPPKATSESGENSVNPPKPIPPPAPVPIGSSPLPSAETIKVLPSTSSESHFTDELQSKLTKLKNQQQVSKPDYAASVGIKTKKCGDGRQSTLGKPLISKDKPMVKNISLRSPPPLPASSSSLVNTLKQKQNSSSNFQHNIIKSKDKEAGLKGKDTTLCDVPKLTDRIAKFQNKSGIKDENVTMGNNRGLNLLKRQQERHKFEDPNLQDNVSETNSSSLRHITDTKCLSPPIPLKPQVPSKAVLKPPVKCSQENFPANVGLKPKVQLRKPKHPNVTQRNAHTTVTKTSLFQAQQLASVARPAPAQVDHRHGFSKKTADGAEIKYQASRSYQAENTEEISFLRGDSIEVLEKDESGWWSVRVGTEEGWAPSNHIEEMKPESNRKSVPPKKPLPKLTPESPCQNTLHSSNNNNNRNNTSTSRQDDSTNDNNSKDDNTEIPADGQYIVLEDFSAFGDEELSVEEGMYVIVTDNSNNDWWHVALASGEEGWVPANCISTVHDV